MAAKQPTGIVYCPVGDVMYATQVGDKFLMQLGTIGSHCTVMDHPTVMGFSTYYGFTQPAPQRNAWSRKFPLESIMLLGENLHRIKAIGWPRPRSSRRSAGSSRPPLSNTKDT